MIRILASAESRSEHPLAAAIVISQQRNRAVRPREMHEELEHSTNLVPHAFRKMELVPLG